MASCRRRVSPFTVSLLPCCQPPYPPEGLRDRSSRSICHTAGLGWRGGTEGFSVDLLAEEAPHPACSSRHPERTPGWGHWHPSCATTCVSLASRSHQVSL